MGEGPIAVVDVVPGLGWPKRVVVDPAVGFPRVSRETLDWTRHLPTRGSRPASDAPALAEPGPGPTARPKRAMPEQPAGEMHSPAPAGNPGEAAPPPATTATASVSESPPAERSPKSSTSPRSIPAAAEDTSGVTVAVLEREPEPAFRAPGPRRARFDQDEFAAPPREEPNSRRSVSRETSSKLRLPRPAQTRTFVVANQKGGVGKTTTSVNVAAALALGGLSVLVVDLDPQGNASTALGVDHVPGTPGTYEVLIAGRSLDEVAQESPEAPGLMVVPATIDLAGAEIELVSMVARENRLLRALRAYLEGHPTDYVILDCPPSLGLLTLNALVAATEILIPIQCEYYALEGVSQLMRTINLVKGELNSSLQVSTVLLTMYDARTRLAAQVADEVRTHFAAETLPTVIPRSVRISEAPSYGQTVLTYHPDSAGAVSYLEAAREIARRGAQEDS
jgi:chromosome partitioning protein